MIIVVSMQRCCSTVDCRSTECPLCKQSTEFIKNGIARHGYRLSVNYRPPRRVMRAVACRYIRHDVVDDLAWPAPSSEQLTHDDRPAVAPLRCRAACHCLFLTPRWSLLINCPSAPPRRHCQQQTASSTSAVRLLIRFH